METRIILLSLGSNVGDRAQNIEDAVGLFTGTGIIQKPTASSFYETEPVGYADQPWFINIALRGETRYEAGQIIQFCKSVEYLLGRKIRKRWTEREIDIDLLLLGEDTLEYDALTVPHPRMHERRFVLAPAAEIAPEMTHPVLRKTVAELLAECADDSVVRKVKREEI
ncbi:MAG: 2-amino-4-hydroxy-6-hydroxymethyldihydropteridine diphosphokinase [Chloroflexota bacterium]